MELKTTIEQWPLRTPFHITDRTFTAIDVLVVTITDQGCRGRGEAAGVLYKNDTPAAMALQIERVRDRLQSGVTREELRELLPSGGARNAVDCALWDLEAQRAERPVWELAGLPTPRPLLTTYTLGAAEPHEMAQRALAFETARALKLKLTGEAVDAERVRAVRSARPDVWIAVDANQGLTRARLERLLPTLVDQRVQLIEQPLPVGQEGELEGFASPIPIAADESVQDLAGVDALVGRFDAMNIKLDKCGGLTEGLMMARAAQRAGLRLMVGNMFGTSLAMAPAFVLGQLCDVVDLDGPIEFVADREPRASYEHGHIDCPPTIWGGSAAARNIR